MRIVNLGSLPCLGKETQLRKLNRLIEISNNLMPHQIATATGCSIDESLAVLLLLLRLSVVDGLLLVYHNAHLNDNPPVLARGILDGMPELPFTCDICQREVVDRNELSYDFLFKLTEKIHFVE